MIEFAMVDRNDLGIGLDHLGVDQAFQRVFDQIRLIYWLHLRLTNFQHQ
jgi:hypothetical protein